MLERANVFAICVTRANNNLKFTQVQGPVGLLTLALIHYLLPWAGKTHIAEKARYGRKKKFNSSEEQLNKTVSEENL